MVTDCSIECNAACAGVLLDWTRYCIGCFAAHQLLNQISHCCSSLNALPAAANQTGQWDCGLHHLGGSEQFLLLGCLIFLAKRKSCIILRKHTGLSKSSIYPRYTEAPRTVHTKWELPCAVRIYLPVPSFYVNLDETATEARNG